MKPKPKQAICIGVNYENTDSELAGCINDAGDWSDLLTRRKFNVTQLTEEDATKENILSTLRRVITAADNRDSIIVTFSGHGTWVPDLDGDEPDARDEAICPVDVFKGNLITDDELYEVFNDRARGVKLVFISDSCHSGTVSRFAPTEQEHQTKVRFLPPSKFLPKSLQSAFLPSLLSRAGASTNALLLAGCRDFEYSYDAWFGPRANGAFSRYLIDAFSELPKSGSYRDLFTLLRTRLPSQSYPQTPQLFGLKSQMRWVAL